MKQEYEEEYRLWEKCFCDTEEYMDYYFAEKTKDNKIMRIYKENELVSMVHLNPYTVFWEQKEWKLYYIVGVCTEETNRKRGYMRKLLKESFKIMKEEQCPFTYLMPAKKEIYEPFDFHFIYTQRRLRGQLSGEKKAVLQAAQLGLLPVEYQELTLRQKEKTADYQNQKLRENYDLYAVRSRAYLERLSLEMKAAGGELLVFLDGKGAVRGTAAYMAEEKDGKIYCEVAEAIFEPEDTTEVWTALEGTLLKRAANWDITFLETGFWKEEELKDMVLDCSVFEYPVIMAKVLSDGPAKEDLERKLCQARVYLNEIV